jgi:hypothetical protein
VQAPIKDVPTIYVTTDQRSYKYDGIWHRDEIYRAALWTTDTREEDDPADVYTTDRRSERELNKAIRALKAEAAKLGYQRVHIVLDLTMGKPLSYNERIVRGKVA